MSSSGSTLPEGQAFARRLLTPSGAAPRLLLLLLLPLLFLLQNAQNKMLPRKDAYTRSVAKGEKYLQYAMHLRAPCVAAEQQRHYVFV